MTESTLKVRSSTTDEALPCANNIKKQTINGESKVVYLEYFTTIPEYKQQAKPIVDRMLERDERRNSYLKVDKLGNPSKKDVLNPEDMPDGKLASETATLQGKKQTLFELLEEMQAEVDQLKGLIARNPELATLHMVGFNPTTTILKSVREAVWGIYNVTGKFIGRNSAEALKADTKAAILNIAPTLMAYDENSHKNIQLWMETEVQAKIDLDLRPAALIMESYRIPATGMVKKVIDRAYTAMATYRRSRSGNKPQAIIRAGRIQKRA